MASLPFSFRNSSMSEKSYIIAMSRTVSPRNILIQKYSYIWSLKIKI